MTIFKFQLPGGSHTLIREDHIFMAHENTKSSFVNLFTVFGEIIVYETDFLSFLETQSDFVQEFTRFNPSTDANRLGVETKWEDGLLYKLYRRNYVPVMESQKWRVIYIYPDKKMRIE